MLNPSPLVGLPHPVRTAIGAFDVSHVNPNAPSGVTEASHANVNVDVNVSATYGASHVTRAPFVNDNPPSGVAHRTATRLPSTPIAASAIAVVHAEPSEPSHVVGTFVHAHVAATPVAYAPAPQSTHVDVPAS